MFTFSNSNNILGILKQLLMQLMQAEAKNKISIQVPALPVYILT